MSPRKARKGASPKIVFGAALLIFAVLGAFLYFGKQRQIADLAEHPKLTHYVMAEGALVSRADEVAIEEQLASLDKDGGAQAVLVVNRRLTAATIADEALQVARRYRIGHAGRDDGIVLLIAANEKKARIEVGYGLEGALTDAQSRLIIANEIEPYLAKDDFSAAARHGVAAIVALLHPAPFAEPVSQNLGVGWLLGVGLFMTVMALVFLGGIQAGVLAFPGAAQRIAASRRWGWFARARILGGDSRRQELRESSSSGGIDSGGSFGGGGAND